MPNPTTINEDQPMTLPETIDKLQELHIKLDFGVLHSADYEHAPTGEEGIACDKLETFIVDPGHTMTDIARYFTELHNALPQLRTALEASGSEKPREWWTVRERAPEVASPVMLWYGDREWLPAFVETGAWFLRIDGSALEMTDDDIWREIPPAPVIVEGKS